MNPITLASRYKPENNMLESSVEAHFDKLYSETDRAFGASREAQSTVARLPLYLTRGAVLELGAGQGRNSLWLARGGFQVEALDISKVAVDLINQIAISEKLALRAIKSDAREQFSGMYDAVVSTYLLHHLSRDEGLKVLSRMKSHTKLGGFNVVAAFTAVGELYAQEAGSDLFYPVTGELRQIYSDWEICEYQESNIAAKKTTPDGRPLFNTVAKLLVKKRDPASAIFFLT